jgi:geranylgeranyl diphosphate synthase type II
MQNALPERFTEYVALIDEALELIIPPSNHPPEPIHRAIRYSLFAGGKRLRPILCFASAESLGADASQVVPAACAIEMIHTYSLVHDDLPCMDNDDFRRGKPTNHKVFGEAIAVLTGDALLTHAFGVLASSSYDGDIRSRLIAALAEAAGTGGMIGGQVMDMVNETRDLSQSELEQLHRMKTAAMISFSTQCAPIILRSGKSVEQAFAEYGNNIGLAFQIVDDILDVESTSEVLGKTAGKDRQRQKVTYPSLFGIDKSRKLAADLIDRACESVKPYDQHSYLSALARFILHRKK